MSTYSNYFIALNSKLLASPAITAALIPPAVIADHIVPKRFRLGDPGDDSYTTNIQLGPMLYMIPSSYDYTPMTADHGKGDAIIEVEVHTHYVNANLASMIAHIKLVDDICVELMTGADGTGGSTSWLSPYGIRLRITTMQCDQLSLTELRTKIKVKAQLLPAV
jgi:hypothetical protein